MCAMKYDINVQTILGVYSAKTYLWVLRPQVGFPTIQGGRHRNPKMFSDHLTRWSTQEDCEAEAALCHPFLLFNFNTLVTFVLSLLGHLLRNWAIGKLGKCDHTYTHTHTQHNERVVCYTAMDCGLTSMDMSAKYNRTILERGATRG